MTTIQKLVAVILIERSVAWDVLIELINKNVVKPEAIAVHPLG